ncbi:MAG: AVAST type 2 anti-phage system protein Avs2 [Cyanobacteriota bacterium]
MNGITLDWSAIRPLNGGRDKGFEELCSQLARGEAPAGSHFIRKGTPDAGVECYAVLTDATEWGWQSKYFDVIGDSQWKQLDESVKAAIDKHPQLIRYFVCVPLDLADARIVGKKNGTKWKSAKEQWDDHVTKWRMWAQERNRTIDFDWWGSSEMLERLSRTENVGRVRFWFGKNGFDGAWFTARLDEAIKAAGPRYTPEIHVELPIAEDLDAFGRTQRFSNRVKALAIPVREALHRVQHSEHSIADAETATMTASLCDAVQTVLNALGAISQVAAGPLPFKSVLEKIEATRSPVQALAAHIEKCAEEHDAQQPKDEAGYGLYPANPFRKRSDNLYRLEGKLQASSEAVCRADELAASTLFILRGDAGTGKTHLLCDVVKQRVEARKPTVLLMGQCFVSNDAPWSQVLQHLDLAGLSAEEFIGALEASAQASSERALIAIDAINEGKGRTVWPTHLAAFLAQVERSPWIGVVLSVRSSYEDVIIPSEVRDRAILVTHQGFREHEYDAMKTFFVHYGLELPSTPLLAPEFQNPLFLKTLCQGLNKQGHQRLPRGFHGISAVFNLYIDAVNARLAEQLGYDSRRLLVHDAIDAFAAALIESGERWLQLERAAKVVDALLPNRDFERSLSRGLVVEGVLAEDSLPREGTIRHDVVYIAYERLADHVVAKVLLNKVPAPPDWAAAFSADGVLAAVTADEYILPGLLEALFIQVAERTDTELLTFAPQLAESWGTGHAFRQSLIWRSNGSFSEATRKVFNDLCGSEDDLHETLEVLLTVASVPEHPLNATFLDRRLRKDGMADRDAWWSTYLYSAWGGHGAVDRVVDWAWAIGNTVVIADDAIDLCGIALTWMLTTSHRFLRDRATKALVNLYTGRLAAMDRLLDRFADVDDLYVRERIFAVAYGVAMRSRDANAIGGLAATVYGRVFESGSPPPHVLMRDYARGVVERALHLGSPIQFDPTLIRPPYMSEWPSIPAEEDMKPLLPDWSQRSDDSMDHEWSRNVIESSVMDDDFARYVIGTNSSTASRDFLSLHQQEPPWSPPPRPAEQLTALIADLSDDELSAWQAFDVANCAYEKASSELVIPWFDQEEGVEHQHLLHLSNEETLEGELEKGSQPDLVVLGKAREEAERALDASLSFEHSARLSAIIDVEGNRHKANRPPGFDLGQVQRYILKRVFDLGWTVERFGHFDSLVVRSDGRKASKPERIGKKYQWIAYHEIMAYLSDHFQFRKEFREDGEQGYQGPWQSHLRDIDPSCTLPALPGGTSWDGHALAWWGAAPYDAWGHGGNPKDWVSEVGNLPKVEDLLVCVNPADGSRWLNGYGFFSWMEKAPPEQRPSDVARGELWCIANAYLIRSSDADAFLKWAETVDFTGHWMPDPPRITEMFLGEHGWAPASRYFQNPNHGYDGWTQPGQGCPVRLRQAAVEYLMESNGIDCSMDDNYTLQLPDEELISKLGIQWAGRGADFTTSSGQLVAQDPTSSAPGPSTLLLRADAIQNLQQREEITLCWAVLGEKRILSSGFNRPQHPALRISSAYIFDGERLRGFVLWMLDEYETFGPQLIDIYRSEI